MRVKLDDVGSFVWRRLDGTTSFRSIVGQMKECFGDRVEPADERLKMFYKILYKDKFVELFAPARDQTTPSSCSDA